MPSRKLLRTGTSMIRPEGSIHDAARNCVHFAVFTTALTVASPIEAPTPTIEWRTRAFAPILIANGGAVLNLLTILARVNLPFMGSYCASKAAALSLTQGLRAELGPKGVRVVAALPGAIDTRMTAMLSIPKMSTADATAEILDGFEAGEEEIYVGEIARGLAAGLASDPKAVERQLANPG